MIDVLLVLLIIFMATAPVQSYGLETPVPRSSPDRPDSKREDPVVLEISENGSYWLNSRIVPASSLREGLIGMFERRGERVLLVKAAGELEFGVVARAIDAAHGVNIDHVALVPR